MRSAVGGRSWVRVSGFTASQTHTVFLTHSNPLFCPAVRRTALGSFPASGGKMTRGSCTALAKPLLF